MQIQKTKNTIRNTKTGLIGRLVGLLLPFILRTVMIRTLGENYIGLSSLFASVLSMLSLAELGFGSALTYSMYKPIAENETEKICNLLNIYKRVYEAVGAFVLVVGLMLIPFLNKLTSGQCPSDLNLYVIYFIYLLNSAVTYFFGGYRSSILLAHQRRDIIDLLNLLVNCAGYMAQIILLILFHNFYIYVILIPVMSITSNVGNALIAKKRYPQYFAKGDLPKEEKRIIFKNVNALFFQKIGTTVSSSFDSMILSAYLGLGVLARYSNYNFIYTSVVSILTIFYNAVLAGIGNSVATSSSETNVKHFNMLTFLNNWCTSWCCITMLCLFQPFIQLWAGENYLLDIKTAICIAVCFYIFMLRKIVLTFKDAAGIWQPDKYKPLVGAAVNLVINILLVNWIGINGVIISTIISYTFIETPWETLVLFKEYLKIPLKDYILNQVRHTILTAFITLLVFAVCQLMKDGIVSIIFRLVVSIVLPNVIFLAFYHRKKEYKDLLGILKREVSKK